MSCQCYLAPIIAAPAHALAPSSTTDAWPLLSPSAATPPYSPWSSPVSRTPGTLRPHRYHCPALMPVLQRPVRASVHCESYITPSFPLPFAALNSRTHGLTVSLSVYVVDSVGFVHLPCTPFPLADSVCTGPRTTCKRLLASRSIDGRYSSLDSQVPGGRQ